jgi:hypothetical protein
MSIAVPSKLRWILLIAGLSCGSSTVGSDDCHHSCPISSFAIDVPKSRVSDVAAVTPIGPCAPEQVVGSEAGVYFFRVTGTGVCHLTVSFQSGAPDFVTDVNITPNPGPCCVGQPTAETILIDVPDGGPVDAAMGN